MKFYAVIAGLAMVDATPVLDRRALIAQSEKKT
jgi:hypothetical protein